MKLADEGRYQEAYETLLSFVSAPSNNDWIVEWNDLWPTKGDVYEATGQPIGYSPKTTITQVVRRMKTYLRDYFPKEFPQVPVRDRPNIIERATRLYLEEKEADGYAYIKKSVKFIQDREGSTLGEYIQQILDQDNPQEDQSSTKATMSW